MRGLASSALYALNASPTGDRPVLRSGPGSALNGCMAEMQANANPIYTDYCVDRCSLWGSSYGISFCGRSVSTNADDLIACLYKMEGPACQAPNGTHPTPAPADTTLPPVATTTTTERDTTQRSTTTQSTTSTTTQRPTTTTRPPTLTTTTTTQRPKTTTTTTATTTRPTTTSTTQRPTTTTTTTRPTTTTAQTTTPTTTPRPPITTPAATTVAPTTAVPDAPSSRPAHQVGAPGFWTPDDAPSTSIQGPTGPNGECVWGYNNDGNAQGRYAGVSNKVYKSKYWAEAGDKPGSSSVWEYVTDCKGTAPEAWTIEAMNAATLDSTKATMFYDSWSPALPSKEETMSIEAAIASTDSVKQLRDAVRVLPSAEVEKITPGRDSNPDNVKRVESFLTSEIWEQLFPFRHEDYSYENFLKAVGAFPNYCKTYTDGRNSEAICKKLIAASFAHYSQETGANAPAWSLSLNDCPQENRHEEAKKYFDASTPIPTYLQGLYWIRETAFSGANAEEVTSSGYERCDPIADQPWSIVFPCSGSATYYGRGSKQLSWNYNYGLFSNAMYGDPTVLLNNPRAVAETWLNFASGIWFAVTPQSPKPPMTWALDGTWTKNPVDDAAHLAPGFGATIEIINGGYECRGSSTSPQAANRIKAYQSFMKVFGLEIPADEPNDCAGNSGFPANSPVSTALYWQKDWSKPYACKQSTVQTPFTVVTPGDYGHCVDFYWRSHVVLNGKEIIKNGDTVW